MSPQHPSGAVAPVSRPLGVQHFINPKAIADADDMVLLSFWGKLVRWLAVAASLLAAFFGLYLLIDGAYALGAGPLKHLLDLATHPVAGLALGVFITAVAQSSTATTALTIAAVAAGSVSVPVAIPVILGANIGTTITPLLAAFSYTGDRRGFSNAFFTASLHAWFNVVVVLALFLVEVAFHSLERVSALVAGALPGGGATTIDAARFTIAGFFQPAVDALGTQGLLGGLGSPAVAGALSVVLGAVVALVALRVMARHLRVLFAATTHSLLESAFATNPLGGFAVGLGGTTLVQASAATVSGLLPLAAAEALRRREALAVILGANVGTTVSGLIAALTVPGGFGIFGLQAALVHVFFNVAAVVMVGALPPLRRVLYRLADGGARRARGSYTLTLLTIAACYWAVPAVTFGAFALLG